MNWDDAGAWAMEGRNSGSRVPNFCGYTFCLHWKLYFQPVILYIFGEWLGDLKIRRHTTKHDAFPNISSIVMGILLFVDF